MRPAQHTILVRDDDCGRERGREGAVCHDGPVWDCTLVSHVMIPRLASFLLHQENVGVLCGNEAEGRRLFGFLVFLL